MFHNRIKMIASVCTSYKDWAIGYDGKLLTSFREDMRFFKKKTMGNIVVMGRKTYESIGNPLIDRINIIVSNDKKWIDHEETKLAGEPFSGDYGIGFLCELSMGKIYDLLNTNDYNDKDVYIIGGASLYKAFLPFAETIYITQYRSKALLDKIKEPDTYFPVNLDRNCQWISEKRVVSGDGIYWEASKHDPNISYCIYEYTMDKNIEFGHITRSKIIYNSLNCFEDIKSTP